MWRVSLVVGIAALIGCGSDAPHLDAPLAIDGPAGDSASAACDDPKATQLIANYCSAGFRDGAGAVCVSDVAQCESKGAYERMTTEQTGCLCYLCQLYSYADEHMLCATSDTPPGYLLQQCLAGALRCP